MCIWGDSFKMVSEAIPAIDSRKYSASQSTVPKKSKSIDLRCPNCKASAVPLPTLFAQAPATVAVFSGVPGLRIQLFPGIASELFFRGF